MTVVDDVVNLSFLCSSLANTGTIWNLFCLSPSGRFPDRLWQICQVILRGAATQHVSKRLTWAASILWAAFMQLHWPACGSALESRPDISGGVWTPQGEAAADWDCSWSGNFFARSVVVWHWQGMVLMSLTLFLHTSQIYLELDFVMQNLFTDCSTCCITVQKMFTWLSFFAQPVSTSVH